MNHTVHKAPRALVACSILALALLAAGCGGKQEPAAQGFATPEAAAQALIAALQRDDLDAAAKLLGPGADELLSSGDPVADKSDRADFLADYALKNSVATEGETATLIVGENDWPLPIPIVKRDGSWAFDGEAAIDELIYRRVGANELGAIDAMYGFVNAQIEYASEGRDGDPAGIYALKLISDEGMQNGLYWPVAEGEPASPVGPYVASAAAEGYKPGDASEPYHGYFYRLLFAQGPNANGGAREYFKDGLMTEGFAAVAWPADYGSSGVMTFIVNADGVVFQKDLGEDTATVVDAMKLFDPDASWTAIVPPEVTAEMAADTP